MSSFQKLKYEHRLGIDRRHAEERDDPHPEDCAGAADEDRAAGADDVAGADPVSYTHLDVYKRQIQEGAGPFCVHSNNSVTFSGK